MNLPQSIRNATGIVFGVVAIALSVSAAPAASAPAARVVWPGPAFLSPSTHNLTTPALIALNYSSQTLEYWPIDHRGGHHPVELVAPSGMVSAQDIVADGERIAIANTGANNIVTYNLRTKLERTFPDAGNLPVDITFGPNHAIYAANIPVNKSNPYTVTEYPVGKPPQVLNCSLLGVAAGITVDKAGDVFVNENTPTTQVVEIPANGNACSLPALQTEMGYAGGITIDPKTNDLLVLSDPDFCAGGDEGLVTIYPPPYNALTGTQLLLGGNCTGGLRLDATSSIAFMLDQTVSGALSYVTQFTYPGGAQLGSYTSGHPISVTTLPNALP